MGLFRRLFGRPSEDEAGNEVSAALPDPPLADTGQRLPASFQDDAAAHLYGDLRDQSDAEWELRRAITSYRSNGDREGLAFSLGRLGDLYQTSHRESDAIPIYEEAIGLNTDIPVVYSSLMSLYAAAGDEDAAFRTADNYLRNVPRHGDRAAELLMRLGTARAKAEAEAEAVPSAERWLLRTEGWSVRSGNAEVRFRAWGQRGVVVEQSGDVARAVLIFEAAVDAGSTDRTTYTRLLMAYERGKRWNNALVLAQRALGIQQDAAWEQDLRTRIARATSRLSPLGTTADKRPVPAFSYRSGADRLSLLDQTTVKYGASRIAVTSDGRSLLVSTAASKPDNVTMLDLSTRSVRWTSTISGASADVFVVRAELFLIAKDFGRIGAGRTELILLNAGGDQIAAMELPDKLSEIRTSADLIVAGCRNGYLYAFDANGRERWRFLVPEPNTDVSPGFGGVSCPYYIKLSLDGRHILFSSWDRVFLLNVSGKCLWTWQATTTMTRFQSIVPFTSDHHYRVLGLATTASPDDARRAFHQRAFDTHPDRHPDDPGASARFREAVEAYEAIISGPSRDSIVLEFSISGGMTSVYELALSSSGEVSLVSTSDGILTRLDGRGRATHQFTVNEGAGNLAATPDLHHIVYAHWKGLNFYVQDRLVDAYPSESLYQLRMAPDGRHVIAWSGKELRLFTTAGRIVSEIECARTISDVTFISPTTFVVAAGKLITLSRNDA